MTNLHNLVEVITARVSDENNLRFRGKNRLKVERTKIDVVQMCNKPPMAYWHNDVQNDFCIYTDVLDPTAAYVYVTVGEDALRSRLVVSDGWDVKDYRDLRLLDASLDDNQIADQLIESVLNASHEVISERSLRRLIGSQSFPSFTDHIH